MKFKKGEMVEIGYTGGHFPDKNNYTLKLKCTNKYKPDGQYLKTFIKDPCGEILDFCNDEKDSITGTVYLILLTDINREIIIRGHGLTKVHDFKVYIKKTIERKEVNQ